MPWLSYDRSARGRGTGLFTACYKSCWALSPEFLNCWATHCKCSCNLGLHITLWDLRTREMVLPCWYCCLSAVPWVTNCLSFSDPLFHGLLLTTLVLWPANLLVCFIISFGIFLLLAILDETGVLPHYWASSFLPFTPFAFWAFTYTISPPRMPSPRALMESCTQKGPTLALMLCSSCREFLSLE